MLIAVVIVLVGGYLLYGALSARQPDYTVGVITETPWPQEALDALQKQIESCGTDLNGDGRVIVQVNNYAFPSSSSSSSSISSAAAAQDAQTEMAQRVKMEADLSSGESVIFLTEPEEFQSLQKKTGMFALTDGSSPKDGKADMSAMRVPLRNCAKLSGLHEELKLSSGGKSEDLFADLGVSLRVKGSSVKAEKYAANQKLFDRLIKG